MIYAYKQSGPLPDGCVGYFVEESKLQFSGDVFGDASVIASSDKKIDISRKKIVNGALVDMTDAECAVLDAKERADRIATITPKLWNMAAIFVATLRQHFGANAETNHEVTAATVEQYFIGKRLAGTLTTLDLADASLLERGFESITAWTGDGTIWSFPWEVM